MLRSVCTPGFIVVRVFNTSFTWLLLRMPLYRRHCTDLKIKIIMKMAQGFLSYFNFVAKLAALFNDLCTSFRF